MQRGEIISHRKTTFSEALIYATVFFPYISFYSFGTDLQPYAMIVCAISCILMARVVLFVTPEMKTLCYICVFAIFIAACSLSGMESLRSLANYISIAVISIAAYNLFLRHGLHESLLKKIILIWFLIGFIQIVFDKNFLTFLLAQARTTDSRGVNGLANEPSFYGITMVLMLFFAKDFKANRKKYMLLIMIQIVFFAQSAFGVILLGIFLLMYTIGDISKRKRLFIIMGLVLLLLSIISTLFIFFPDQRITALIRLFFTGDITRDASAMQRFDAIIDSLEVFWGNYFLPEGFHTRIMSGYGAILVELGAFGIPLIVTISMSAAKTFNNKKARIINAILFSIFMFGAVQLAHPVVAFIVGYGIYKKQNK